MKPEVMMDTISKQLAASLGSCIVRPPGHVSQSPKTNSQPSSAIGAGAASQSGSEVAISREFEELLLKQVVEAMLPKGAGDLYGGGAGASMWRSMLSDSIAAELAERGILGLGTNLTSLRRIDSSKEAL